MADQELDNFIAADDWIPALITFMKEGKTVKLTPHGYSMWPLLRSDKDEVIMCLPNCRLRRGDICLYRRDNGLYVLHRIHHVDAKKNEYYMIGDNQVKIEGPLQRKQILAVASDIIRDGKTISCNNMFYIVISRTWLILRRFRYTITKVWRKFRKVTVGK